MTEAIVYKIVGVAEWAAAEVAGRYRGSPDDVRDGFVHLSAADQLAETANRHFRGRDDLVLVAVDAEALGAALRYEPSRGGALFPHLYGDLPLSAVVFVRPMVMLPDGTHRLPELAV
jgi:uncharacterized protein (DUF952 family)